MKEKSVKKNYFYNLIYQILILILPLITTPYISRVLGAEQIGIYSYTVSVVTYFVLFGSLGVSLYGQREIAYIGEDVSKRKKTFWEIIILRTITITIAIVVYYFAIIKSGEYTTYYKILTFYIVASAFDISWLFQGLEEFRKTVGRNIVVRTISVILIFTFVKKPEDLTKYLLIYSFADLIGNISLWFYLPKYLKGEKIGKLSLTRHFMPIIILFIPQVAIKIYNVLDKTMLGALITNKAELGNYEEAYKIINVLYTIIASLGIVMIPKIASLHHRGEKGRLSIYIKKSFNFVFFLTFPMMFGIVAVAEEFIPFFLGEGYELAINITKALSPLLILQGITNVIGTQYLLPTQKHKEYTISILVGLVINVIINLLLIKTYKSIGVAIATVISQFVVAIIQIFCIRKEIDIKNIFKLSYKYLTASVVMLIICQIVGKYIYANNITLIILKTLIGIITYTVILIILKDDYIKNLKDTAIAFIKREE